LHTQARATRKAKASWGFTCRSVGIKAQGKPARESVCAGIGSTGNDAHDTVVAAVGADLYRRNVFRQDGLP
jgi:hypothetical protein